jgi:hypothetical protein
MTKKAVIKKGATKKGVTKNDSIKTSATMDMFRFSRSAIDELNGNPGMHGQTRKQFALLLAGLSVVLLMLYAMIVW